MKASKYKYVRKYLHPIKNQEKGIKNTIFIEEGNNRYSK